jgi:hypothetical protein
MDDSKQTQNTTHEQALQAVGLQSDMIDVLMRGLETSKRNIEAAKLNIEAGNVTEAFKSCALLYYSGAPDGDICPFFYVKLV